MWGPQSAWLRRAAEGRGLNFIGMTFLEQDARQDLDGPDSYDQHASTYLKALTMVSIT